jgi:hypothetical protein
LGVLAGVVVEIEKGALKEGWFVIRHGPTTTESETFLSPFSALDDLVGEQENGHDDQDRALQ